MTEIQSVHAWGFFDGNGKPRIPDGIAPSELSAFDHYERLIRHLEHFGTELARQATTRDLNGRFIAVEFETEARHGCAPMWHTVTRPQNEWPDFPATTEPTGGAA